MSQNFKKNETSAWWEATKKLQKVGLGLGVMLSMNLSTVAPSQAFFFLADPAVQEQIEHLVECVELLFADPEAHARLCGPANEEPVFSDDEDEDEEFVPPPAPEPSPAPESLAPIPQ